MTTDAKVMCEDCQGEGYVEYLCSGCNGSGEGWADGTTCRTCGGPGEYRKCCGACEGDGEVYPDEEDENDKAAGSGQTLTTASDGAQYEAASRFTEDNPSGVSDQ